MAPDGNGGYAMTQALELDLGLADPPTITSATSPATPTTPVTVTGAGDAGDTISLYDGATFLGTTTVHADGTWSTSVLLAVGRHDLTATQTVNLPPNAGVSSAPSREVDVVVVPDAPVVGSVVQTGSSHGLTSASVGGTGAAGDVVTLYDDGHPIGGATVGGDGAWSVTVSLRAGIHVLTASQTAPGRFAGGTGAALTVQVAASGAILPYAPPPAPSIAKATQTTVNGTGVAGDTVLLYDGGDEIATADVGRDGTWSARVQLCAGTHSLTAVQEVVDGAPGASSAAIVVTFFAPTPAPSFWEPSQSVAAGTPFTVVGSGVAGDTITLYDGTATVGTTTVAADGSWSITISLAAGRHDLAATQTDPSSTLVSGFTHAEDVTAYVLPSVAPITAAVPSSHGPSSTYRVSGTGVAGDTVTAYDGSTPVASALVGRNGAWSVSVRLAPGTHTLSTTQTVGSFVTGPTGAAVTVTV
jgi:hypothetical protein